MLDLATPATFREHVGSTFHVDMGDGQSLELRLARVTPLRPPPPGTPGRVEPFSLIFQGPTHAGLYQASHTLVHDSLGTLEIFLVPVGPLGEPNALCYEAIFN